MTAILKEYFGWTSERAAEGWFSWQHLTYVTLMVAIATVLGILLGRKYRSAEEEKKLHVLRVASVVMICCELFKIVLISVRNQDPMNFRSMLPLFLCSIMIFSLPIAAFARGRIRYAALDFSFCFGFLCCFAGTYLAGNYFSNSPVLSFDPMISVTTHCISGFAAVYIAAAGLVTMKAYSFAVSSLILALFEGAALAVDLLQRDTSYESNYMFFIHDAGTPFSLCRTLVGGDPVLYAIFVALLYFVYLGLFFGVTAAIRAAAAKRRNCRAGKPVVQA